MTQDTSDRMNAALRGVTGRKMETETDAPQAESREHWKVVDGVAFRVRPPEDDGQEDRPPANAGAGTGTEYPRAETDMNAFIRRAAKG